MLRAGDSAEVLFRWAHWPEIIEPGCALIFRENSVKGVGTVTWVGDFEESPKKRRSGFRPQISKLSKSANDKKRDRGARGARSEKAGKVSAKQFKGRKGKRSKR